MRFLRKISPSPYADSTHSVMAYPGEGLEFETTQPDNTNVVPLDPRMEAIGQAHDDAVDRIARITHGVTERTYRSTRNVPLTIIVGTGVAGARVYHDCWASCHNESPPREPPVPEIPAPQIETEEKDGGN